MDKLIRTMQVNSATEMMNVTVYLVPTTFGLFLIDKQGVVRHQVVNDMPLGRSVNETLRMIDALQHHEEYGEVCPADWKVGEKAMAETAEGVAKYLSER